MAESSASVTQTTTIVEDGQESRSPTLLLKLKKPKNDKQVKWTTETVDNEHMNKKKSKCCCIYEKPRMFGDSSSDEDGDDECGHCHGHKQKCFRADGDPKKDDQGPSGVDGAGPSSS